MRGLALLAGVLVCSVCAFGQAMAEGALTHALSTATGTAMGKAMGNVTNQMANRVAGRLGQQTSTAVPKSRIQMIKPGVQGTAAVPPSGTAAEPPAGGSLIASIQGAAPQPACDSSAQDSSSKKTDPSEKPPACATPNDNHPSEITLPAPK
jgi:hypothetical protein